MCYNFSIMYSNDEVREVKSKYIELMEKALDAYSIEHIKRYFSEVKEYGLKEHGFPRLTANIGILISHGRRTELLELFLEMMGFCCKNIPHVKAANDFSVREIISCIFEIEKCAAIDAKTVNRWKAYLSEIEPTECYSIFAKKETDKVKNWALFTAVSEFFREEIGLCNSREFIDVQLASQIQWLDENGMYMDGEGDNHQPIMYDLVPRGLFALLLNEGYRGKHYNEIDACLKKSALLTLKMQSPNGEMAFGGRSNQFIHNEPWMAAVYEYEAKRYAAKGDTKLVREFKSAIKRALSVTENWLSLKPVSHIKNRFPVETKYGCEEYAYFDKYMITVASNLYAAYLIADDAIPDYECSDIEPVVFETTEHFHKLFVKAGGYGLEFDLNADSHYDASGLGRIHKAGKHSAICLSVPCPKNPKYSVDIEKPCALSFSPGVCDNSGEWTFATDTESNYELVDSSCTCDSARVELCTRFKNGKNVVTEYEVSGNCVRIHVRGEGKVAYLLPAFLFDGESHTNIVCTGKEISISYKGDVCRYAVDGEISTMPILAANRNGHYKAYVATGEEHLAITVQII